MMQKMQCYTIINVITSDKEAVYDNETDKRVATQFLVVV